MQEQIYSVGIDLWQGLMSSRNISTKSDAESVVREMIIITEEFSESEHSCSDYEYEEEKLDILCVGLKFWSTAVRQKNIVDVGGCLQLAGYIQSRLSVDVDKFDSFVKEEDYTLDDVKSEAKAYFDSDTNYESDEEEDLKNPVTLKIMNDEQEKPTLKVPLKSNLQLSHPIPCPYCEEVKQFPFPQLKSHVRKEHFERFEDFKADFMPFACPEENCKKRFRKRKVFLKHMKVVHENRYKPVNRDLHCIICDTIFENHEVLKRHLESHRGTIGNMIFKCSFCEKIFKSRQDLKSHLRIHEPEIPENFTVCDLCGETLKSDWHRRNHLVKHRTHDVREKALSCDECDEEFPKLSLLRKHQFEAHDKGAVFCNICGHKSKSDSYLKVHMASHKEESEKEYMCSDCGMAFGCKSYLQRHYNRVHEGNKRYKCSECGKCVASKSILEGHMNMHLGIKPYKCEYCGNGYQNAANLGAHHKKSKCGKSRNYI